VTQRISVPFTFLFPSLIFADTVTNGAAHRSSVSGADAAAEEDEEEEEEEEEEGEEVDEKATMEVSDSYQPGLSNCKCLFIIALTFLLFNPDNYGGTV
jgi:hypothetical protein